MNPTGTAAALLAGTLLLCGCGSDKAAQQRAVVDGYRQLAAAGYADSLTGAEALLTAIRKLIDRPDAAALDAARRAWIAARHPYAQTEVLRFGNWVVDDWETQVNAWPLDEGLIDYVDGSYLGTPDNPLARADLIHADAAMLGGLRADTTQINSALLAQLQRMAPVETAVAVGYHAIEFLLWGQDRSANEPGQRPWTDYARDAALCSDGDHRSGSARSCERRGQYLLAVTQLLIQDLKQMRQHWTADVGSYGMRLVRGEPREGLRRMLYGMASLAAAELAGERIDVALRTQAQEEEQDCFSDQTHASLKYNLSGIANVWHGRYQRDDDSVTSVPALRDLVAEQQPALALRIDAQLTAGLQALDRVEALAAAGQSFDQQILDRPAGARAALQQLSATLRTLAQELEAAGTALQLGALNPAQMVVGDASGGGATTARKRVPDEPLERDAFSQPAANLDAEGRARFTVGNSFFTAAWVIAPASTTARDGLGPLYNASACQQCHVHDGRGHPPDAARSDSAGALVRIAVPAQADADAAAPDPVYGNQIQDRGVPGVAAEARIQVRWETARLQLADGTAFELRKSQIELLDPAYGAIDPSLRRSLRIAPPMIGLGLLEAIDETAIRAGADPDDRNGDGISGRVSEILVDGHPRLGRFGWKAAQATIRLQVGSALNNDMGLTSAAAAPALCTPTQRDCRAAPTGGDPEVATDILDALVFYAGHLAVPARRWTDVDEVRSGEQVFARIGCANCHRLNWRTSAQAASAALADQAIQPYSDLLLHDMGTGLADGIREGSAAGNEWRTPPLWGLHLTRAVSGAEAGFLHDGRARSLEEAILWHDGEAAVAQQRFIALPKAEREALVWFLKSL